MATYYKERLAVRMVQVADSVHDPERMGMAARGFRQKLTGYYGKLPGRDR